MQETKGRKSDVELLILPIILLEDAEATSCPISSLCTASLLNPPFTDRLPSQSHLLSAFQVPTCHYFNLLNILCRLGTYGLYRFGSETMTMVMLRWEEAVRQGGQRGEFSV